MIDPGNSRSDAVGDAASRRSIRVSARLRWNRALRPTRWPGASLRHASRGAKCEFHGFGPRGGLGLPNSCLETSVHEWGTSDAATYSATAKTYPHMRKIAIMHPTRPINSITSSDGTHGDACILFFKLGPSHQSFGGYSFVTPASKIFASHACGHNRENITDLFETTGQFCGHVRVERADPHRSVDGDQLPRRPVHQVPMGHGGGCGGACRCKGRGSVRHSQCFRRIHCSFDSGAIAAGNAQAAKIFNANGGASEAAGTVTPVVNGTKSGTAFTQPSLIQGPSRPFLADGSGSPI